MRRLVLFILLSNGSALLLLTALSWISPWVASWQPIDLMFLTGVFFWLISSVVRLSTQRIKKGWRKNDMEVTDPQIVMSTDNLATRFLLAGCVPLLGAILWGFFY